MIDPSIRLRRAIQLHDVALVKRIVRHHPNLIRNPDFDDKSATSLHLAAREGLVEVTEFLIESGHEDQGISHDTDGSTPLMTAAISGQAEVGMVLAKGFPWCIPWQNKAGLDALMLAARHPPSAPLLQILLSVPLSAYSIPNPVDNTSTTSSDRPSTADSPQTIHGSSRPTSPPTLIPTNNTTATQPHFLVTARDGTGSTALHHASAAGSLKALRILLQAGADPRAENAYSWTPLDYSASVAAEVYFKNLVQELERRRLQQQHMQQQQQQQQQQQHHQASLSNDSNASSALNIDPTGATAPLAPPLPPAPTNTASKSARAARAAGVRLVTEGLEDDNRLPSLASLTSPNASSDLTEEQQAVREAVAAAVGRNWSPSDPPRPGSRRAMTPTSSTATGRTFDWSGGSARTRAGSGE